MCHQSDFIDHRASRSVDDYGIFFHEAQGALVDEVASGGVQKRVDAHNISLPKQLIRTAYTLARDRIITEFDAKFTELRNEVL